MTRTKSKSGPSAPGHGVFDPDNFWGRILPGPLVLDRHLPFEERVERGWKRLKLGFYDEEQGRLREVLAELIAKKDQIDGQLEEPSP